MADTIDVPVIGPTKKLWVWGGLATVAVIVGFAYVRRAAAGPADIVDPALLPPSDELDPGAQTTAGITFPARDEPDPDSLPPTTNPQWVQRAVLYMQGLAYDSQLVATTLGKYLARQPLANNESDIVRTVEGAIGRPPEGTYNIIPIGTPSTPKPPSGGGTPAPTPVVPEKVSVPLETNLYTWTAQIAARYKIPYSLPRMRQLNPWVDGSDAKGKYIVWQGDKSPFTPVFRASGGIPPVRIR